MERATADNFKFRLARTPDRAIKSHEPVVILDFDRYSGTQHPAADIELSVRSPATPDLPIAVSVIIPLAPYDPDPQALLAFLPKTFEVLFARGGTRASSMNRAAAQASGQHLWFVHADTILRSDTVGTLLEHLAAQPNALHYFDLCFDGGAVMRLTELGVGFRSRVFGLPFGDQALCIPAEAFRALGGYNEQSAYGEDLLLVRSAGRAGVPLVPVGAKVTTSARKYRKNGWFRTTLEHWWLTLRLLNSRS